MNQQQIKQAKEMQTLRDKSSIYPVLLLEDSLAYQNNQIF